MSATSMSVSASVEMAAANTSGMASQALEKAAPRAPVEPATRLPYIMSACMMAKPTPPASDDVMSLSGSWCLDVVTACTAFSVRVYRWKNR